MKKRFSYKLRLGAFILTGLLLILALLAYMGSKQNLFRQTIELNGHFKKVGGLRSGNNVTFSGINIGVVKSVEIVNDTNIRVRVQVERKVAKFIKTDSKMLITSEGLMGNRMLTISSGNPDAESVKDGDYLQTESPFDIEEVLVVFQSAGNDIALVANNIKGITEQIQQGNGFAGKILSDPEFAQKMDLAVDHFKQSGENTLAFTRDINRLSSDIREGKGVLGMLSQDEVTATRLRNVIDSLEAASAHASETARNMAAFTEGISKDSPIGNLLHDEEMGEDLKQTIRNLEGNTAEFTETMRKIRGSWLLNGLFSKDKNNKANQDDSVSVNAETPVSTNP